jgi:hypothetical protein
LEMQIFCTPAIQANLFKRRAHSSSSKWSDPEKSSKLILPKGEFQINSDGASFANSS